MDTGILLPFEINASGEVGNASDSDLAVSKVQLVLGTRPGEVDWRPDFGCQIHRLRHQNNTPMLAAMAEYYVRLAFAQWLTSYVLTRVQSTVDGRVLRMSVAWIERATAGSPTFPRELTTQVQVPLAAGATIATAA